MLLKFKHWWERGPGRGCTHFISMGRDVQTKGVLISGSVWNRGVFHCKKFGNRFKYTYLVRASCLPGKGMVNYPSLDWGYHKLILIMI